jgi:hypothetical protein
VRVTSNVRPHGTTYDTMNLLETHAQLIGEKLSAMKHGTEAGLAVIFGADWQTIGTSGHRREFGRLFKAAVLRGAYTGIEWVRIENSGRYDVYRKS